MKIITINIVINSASVLLHILSAITSMIIVLLVFFRWNFNRKHHLRHSIISICCFDDSISLLIIGNIYWILFCYSTTWLSVLFHTIAGDFSILEDVLNLQDSTACRLRVALIFTLTSALFHSFLIHALWCFFKVIYHSESNVKILWFLSPNHVSTYIILIFISWTISILIVIPAQTIFKVFSYFPGQYHCLISFTNISGFSYSLLSSYAIPVLVIVYIYSRLIIFIHNAFNSNHLSRARREIRIVKRIINICVILSLSGSPTLVFLFQFIVTGKVHPLADRVHELGVAINATIVTIGFAILNSLIKLLPSRSSIHRKSYYRS